MKRNRKKVLVTVSLVLAFIFTYSSLTFFASEADSEVIIIQNDFKVPVFGVLDPNADETGVSTPAAVANETLSRNYTWEYNTNEYFNDYITSACVNCHDDNCYTNGSCDCESEDGAIQCCGYARLVFKALTGYYPRETNHVTDSTGTYGTTSTTVAKVKNLRNLHGPIYLRLMGPNTDQDYGHYICVIEMTDSGLFFCDANGFNRAGYCQVKNEQYITYESFVSRYTKILQVVTPKNCHYIISSLNARSHTYGCTGCSNSYSENHNMNSTWCVECHLGNTHINHETTWGRDSSYHWTICSDCDDLQITDKEAHNFGLAGIRCECGIINATINSGEENIMLD